ncbi:MAG: hypothetical protein RHS_0923 [Robinsoniella sp. RHS]|nr:MAG: hypothetical protein RHS_0923 [Robinsoniella sp. RHS]
MGQQQDYPSIYHHSGSEHFIRHGLGDWGIQQNKGECREKPASMNSFCSWMLFLLCWGLGD